MYFLMILLADTFNPTSLLGAVWAMIYFFSRYTNKQSIPDMTRPVIVHQKPVILTPYYFSNGRKIHETHEAHYCKILGIANNQMITYEKIHDAAIHKLNICKRDTPSDFRTQCMIKYESAAQFLIDRWAYMGQLN